PHLLAQARRRAGAAGYRRQRLDLRGRQRAAADPTGRRGVDRSRRAALARRGRELLPDPSRHLDRQGRVAGGSIRGRLCARPKRPPGGWRQPGSRAMIVEMRVYHCLPGRLPALNERFTRHTLSSFGKHGIRPIGFWTTLVGPTNHALTYLLEWQSLAER